MWHLFGLGDEPFLQGVNFLDHLECCRVAPLQLSPTVHVHGVLQLLAQGLYLRLLLKGINAPTCKITGVAGVRFADLSALHCRFLIREEFDHCCCSHDSDSPFCPSNRPLQLYRMGHERCFYLRNGTLRLPKPFPSLHVMLLGRKRWMGGGVMKSI